MQAVRQNLSDVWPLSDIFPHFPHLLLQSILKLTIKKQERQQQQQQKQQQQQQQQQPENDSSRTLVEASRE